MAFQGSRVGRFQRGGQWFDRLTKTLSDAKNKTGRPLWLRTFARGSRPIAQSLLPSVRPRTAAGAAYSSVSVIGQKSAAVYRLRTLPTANAAVRPTATI